MNKSIVFYGPKSIDKAPIIEDYLSMNSIPKSEIFELPVNRVHGTIPDIRWPQNTGLIIFKDIQYRHLKTIWQIHTGQFVRNDWNGNEASQVIATLDTDYDLLNHFGDGYSRWITYIKVTKLIL